MTGFLSSLGQKLAERWLTVLVLPGALFEGVLWLAAVLGHRRPWDVPFLAARATAQTRALDGEPVAQALLLVALLLGAFGAGLAANALAGPVVRCWFARGPRRLARPLVERRRRRWDDAHRAYESATAAEGESTADFERRRGELAARRNAIALARPFRPTWMGDQLDAVAVRVRNRYGIDLDAAWPRLWLVVPDHARTTIGDARAALTGAATTAAWGVLYLAVAAVTLWWPAALVGVVTIAVGHRRGRSATGTLAQVCEATADLYGAELARALNVPLADGKVTQRVGFTITELLRKGA
ncbi:hypothetical protein ACNF49_39590 [Actinomadura sp. ATCC 39365]|uniref:hypothetical protein n=1 Tax=Nonomuraea sp. NPDC005692 TaxID=3157168 RepID=UPI00340ED2F6